MATRSVSTSFGSLSSHVLSKSGAHAPRHFTAVAIRRTQTPFATSQTRHFTCSPISKGSNPFETFIEEGKKPEPAKKPEPPAEAATSDPAEEPSSDQPWYLQVEPPSHPAAHKVAPLPAIPAGSPAMLEPLMKYVYEEMGLDDLVLLDLRDFDPPPALGSNLLMLIGTARSERHLHVSSGRLVRWLRYNYKLEAAADGLIGAGELKTKLRRLRRKAKLLGSSTIATPGGDDGISVGWICVNMGALGAESSEAAHFDPSGQLSGFGNSLPELGSTVVVQVLTESRRAELKLETLWQDSLARNQRQRQAFSSAPPREDRPPKANKPRPREDWEKRTEKPVFQRKERRVSQRSAALRRPPQAPGSRGQSRWYSTERSIDSEPAGAESEAYPSISAIQKKILSIQSTPSDGKLLRDHLDVFRQIFSPGFDESHAPEQVALAEDALRVVTRLRPNAIDNELLVLLICHIARSGSKSPILARAQANLESLMTIKQLPCLLDSEITSLLHAYAAQGNWDRFWEVWRVPPRFHQPRSEELYAEMFKAVASSRSTLVCIDALRNCVNDMQFETPPVFPGDDVYHAIRDCMAFADPTAIETAEKVATGEAAWEMVSRTASDDEKDGEKKESRARILFERHRDREFVKMIYELESARRQMKDAQGPWLD